MSLLLVLYFVFPLAGLGGGEEILANLPLLLAGFGCDVVFPLFEVFAGLDDFAIINQ